MEDNLSQDNNSNKDLAAPMWFSKKNAYGFRKWMVLNGWWSNKYYGKATVNIHQGVIRVVAEDGSMIIERKVSDISNIKLGAPDINIYFKDETNFTLHFAIPNLLLGPFPTMSSKGLANTKLFEDYFNQLGLIEQRKTIFS